MKVEVELQATYADTDQMGFVHHSNYMKYLENARWEAFRQLGLPYKEIEENGILIPVIEVNMKFLKPIYYDDKVRVSMDMQLTSPTKLSIDYTIFNEDSVIINKATTVLTFLRKCSYKPCRIPDFIHDAISSLALQN